MLMSVLAAYKAHTQIERVFKKKQKILLLPRAKKLELKWRISLMATVKY